jgi:hypothetical protein
MVKFFENTRIGPVIISVLVVVNFFFVIALLLLKPVKLDDNITSILMILIGALGNEFAHVVQYWTGSSSGSKEKDALHADILRNLGNNNKGAPGGDAPGG